MPRTNARNNGWDIDGGWLAWNTRKRPYFKVLVPGMSLWHHSTYEPSGTWDFWDKGGNGLYSAGETLTIPACDGSIDRGVPPNPGTIYPLIACPPWWVSADFVTFTLYTPHRFQPIPTGLNASPGAPAEYNMGYADGHVRYYAVQKAAP